MLAVTLLFANFICVTAGDESSNSYGIRHYLNDELLEDEAVVFVGEVFKSQVYAQIDEPFTSWGMALDFDKSMVNLVSFKNNETVDADGVLKGEFVEDDLWEGLPGVKTTILDNWGGYITTNESMPYVSNENGYVWLYGYVGSAQDAANLPNEVSVLEMNFKALAVGDPDSNPDSITNIGFAVEGDSQFDQGMKDDGIMFAMNNAHLPLAEPSINSVVIKEKPDAPTVAWSDNKATWSDVVSRGFIVNLYKEGTTDPVATSELLGADINEYDFSESLTTPGDYYFIVTAKGGTYDTDSEKSGLNNITIPLAAPETPTWDTTTVGKLNWNDVVNAVDYEVIIYKKDGNGDFVPYGEPIKVEGANSKELEDILAEVGEYKARVKALATGTGYTASLQSDYSAVFTSGTNVSGYVELDHLDDAISKLETATDITNEEKALWIDGLRAKNGGMKIELYKASDHTWYTTTYSNADGSFAIPTILSGNYDIVISADGVITRIIENVAINGENFVLSTEANPVNIWPGNVSVDDDTEASGENHYRTTFINPADIAFMVERLHVADKYVEYANFDGRTGISLGDLSYVLEYAGKNSLPNDPNSYPDWDWKSFQQ